MSEVHPTISAMPKARRMRELKARMLHAASIVIGEAVNWGAGYEYADELGLDAMDVEKVCSKISDELFRRSVRITDSEIMDLQRDGGRS